MTPILITTSILIRSNNCINNYIYIYINKEQQLHILVRCYYLCQKKR